MLIKSKILLSALLAVIVSDSAIAQSADLSMKWKPDFQYSIKQSLTLDMTMPNPDPNVEGEMETKMNMVMGMKGDSSIDEQGVIVDMKFDTIIMSMNMDGKLLMDYDSSKPNPESQVGKAMAPLLELKFKSLYGKDGKYIGLKEFDEKLLKPEMGITRKGLESMMKQQSQMIPNREVKVGESWEAVMKVPLQGFEDGLSCNYNFKLSSISVVEGKEIARIDFTAEMKEAKVKQNGIDMLMSAKSIDGFFLFDVKEGQFTESKVFLNMVAKVQGVEMTMKMKTKIDFEHSPLKK